MTGAWREVVLNDGNFEKTNIVLNPIKKKIACIIKKKKIRETRR